ncbi:MAG: HEAT repeat domain-containing protein [SAR324 cluster bacterium]|nr:HEAT repeat domain-containing protein [SAR324 cluster bacterium]
MTNKVIDLYHYRDPSSTMETVLTLLSKWSQKSREQANLDHLRLRSLLPALFLEFNHYEMELRIKVIDLLAQAQISEAVPFLVAYLSDSDPEMKASVIQALGVLKNHFAVLPLKNAYDHESPELRQEILKALSLLVDDVFFSHFLGSDPNLNRITIAMELLDMLSSENQQLLSPRGFRMFLDQLLPHFLKIRRADFDVKTLKQTINTLENELHTHHDQHERALETMKFQMKIQHLQLQGFLEVPSARDVLESDAPVEEKPYPVQPQKFLSLKEVIIQANKSVLEEDTRNNVRKKVTFTKTLQLEPSMAENLLLLLKHLMSLANSIARPDRKVQIRINDIHADQPSTSTIITMKGTAVDPTSLERLISTHPVYQELKRTVSFLGWTVDRTMDRGDFCITIQVKSPSSTLP